MYNKKLICITGPDGSGKSTLINSLLAHFPSAKKIGIWDAFASNQNVVFDSKASIDNYLCKLSPLSRTFFLTHALHESIKNIEKSEADIIFLDSYFYKYYCSELTLGTPLEIIKTLSQHFIQPDVVISLIADASLCATRKNTFTRYECGLDASPNKKSFIDFQKKCADNWPYFKQDSWVNIDATNTSENILEITIKTINNLCKSI